jgi:hypothetical protein
MVDHEVDHELDEFIQRESETCLNDLSLLRLLPPAPSFPRTLLPCNLERFA